MEEMLIFTRLLRKVDDNNRDVYDVMHSWGSESPIVGGVEWFKYTNMIEVDELREELYPWLERGDRWEDRVLRGSMIWMRLRQFCPAYSLKMTKGTVLFFEKKSRHKKRVSVNMVL